MVLFSTKDRQGIGLSSYTRRQVTRHQGNEGKQHRDAHKRDRVSRGYSEEQALHKSGHEDRNATPDRQANQSQDHAVSDHLTQDGKRRSAQRDAYAELLATLRHRVGNNAMQTQNRQEHGDAGKR